MKNFFSYHHLDTRTLRMGIWYQILVHFVTAFLHLINHCVVFRALFLKFILRALKTLHLASLQLVQILLADVYSSDLVAHNVRLDVLLGLGL